MTPDADSRSADHTALGQLVARYAWSVAQGLEAGVAELFCEDGWFEGSAGRILGRKLLADFFSQAAGEYGKAVPLVGNMIFELNGDAATGVATLVGFQDHGQRTFAGHYQDVFRRVDGDWLFHGRRFVTYFDHAFQKAL